MFGFSHVANREVTPYPECKDGDERGQEDSVPSEEGHHEACHYWAKSRPKCNCHSANGQVEAKSLAWGYCHNRTHHGGDEDSGANGLAESAYKEPREGWCKEGGR